MKMTDNELCLRGFTILAETFGDVSAERFVMLMNREPFDYTEWRRTHLYVNDDLHSLAERAHAIGKVVRSRGLSPCVQSLAT